MPHQRKHSASAKERWAKEKIVCTWIKAKKFCCENEKRVDRQTAKILQFFLDNKVGLFGCPRWKYNELEILGSITKVLNISTELNRFFSTSPEYNASPFLNLKIWET